jgi:hypothetical protein
LALKGFTTKLTDIRIKFKSKAILVKTLQDAINYSHPVLTIAPNNITEPETGASTRDLHS